MNVQCATLEQRLLEYIFGRFRRQRTVIGNGYGSETNIIINEYYTGTKTLKEKILGLMIKKIDADSKG